MFESFGEHGVIHTRSHRNTHAHAHEGHTKLRIRRYWSKKKKKRRRQPRHWKEQPTGFLNVCGLEFHSAEMGRVSTLQTADLRVLPACFQCLLAGWFGPRHSRLGIFIQARMQRRERTRRWALCMYEAFSVDVGHARRCTQEDYLILIHATWYNVIKHLTWEISSILIRERTGGN